MKTTKLFLTKKTVIGVCMLSVSPFTFAQISAPPILPPQMATSTAPLPTQNSSEVSKRQIKQATSKLSELPLEKRDSLEAFPIAKTTLTAVEQLLTASLQSETLINKVESFVVQKKASGMNTDALEASLADAKNTLESANISISMASSLTETWANTVSTSTYKKAVQSKKVEYKAALDSARQNIRKTNTTLRTIVTTFITPPSTQTASTSPVIVDPTKNPALTQPGGLSPLPIPQTTQGASSSPLIMKAPVSTSTEQKKINVIEQ